MRLWFSVAGGRDPRAGLLSLLVVLALLLCHGLFGGLHLVVSGPAHPGASADGFLAGGHASHAGSTSDGQGEPRPSAPHHLLPGSSDYAAVLVAALGAALGLLLGSPRLARRSLGGTARRGDAGFVSTTEVPVLARGPDRRALLQVFQL